MILTPPVSAFSSVRDGGMSEAHMAGDEEEERKRENEWVSIRQRKVNRVGEQTGY